MRRTDPSCVNPLRLRRLLHGAVASAVLLLMPSGASRGQATPAEPSEPQEIRPLEVVGRYRFETPGPRAVDIRWAEKGSVYLLHPTRGVAKYSLKEGLPREESILPGRDHEPALRSLVWLAASDGHVAAAGVARTIVWNVRGSSGTGVDAELFPGTLGNISDIDLDGDNLALLGYRPGLEGQEPEWDAVVWTGSLEEHLNPLRPLFRDPKATPGSSYLKDLAFSLTAKVGSLRFLANGDLMVFVGNQPVLMRLSSSGKVEKEWDLAQLGIVGELRAPEEGKKLTRDNYGRWISRSASIDDLVILGKETPALFVRRPAEGGIERRLAVLEGESVAWYSVPVRAKGATLRLRGDVARNGDIAVLVSDRAEGWKDEPTKDQEVLVLRVP